jgi:putative ABC transport system permease protein
LWQRRFGTDPLIVGKKATIDGQPFEIIGVLASDFQFFQSDFDLWMPLTVDNEFHNRQNHSVMVYGRLAPGVSIGQARRR